MSGLILVIEDDIEIRKDIVKTLELSGYFAIDAPSGESGIELAFKQKPDLIICDIMMPGIDGYEVLDRLMKNPDTSTIPFIFLSAKSSAGEVRDGMNLGADDFITKPYDLITLLDAVDVRLKKSRATEKRYYERLEELRTNIKRALPHEIRTPLNIILGMAEFLKKSYENISPDEVREMLSNIYDSGKRLHRLFENYLFYANLEILAANPEDVRKLRSKKTIMPDVIIRDNATYTGQKYSRHNDFEFDLDEAILAVQENHFSKLAEEIIDNCAKFSEPGTPIRIASVADKKQYIISFTDFGRGMTREQISSIGADRQFERLVYEQQGTGMGFAICKRLVEFYNGDFYVVSQPGSFTTVTVKLPVWDV